jgi:hypothetical protein
VGGEVQAAAGPEVGVRPDRRHQPADALDRFGTELIAAARRGGAVATAEVGEVGVQLVLEEGGGGAGAAVAHLPSLQQDGVESLLREPLPHHRAGDAAADDRHVAAAVLRELGIGRRQPVLDEPEGNPGREIHAGN